jgi:hypothetical protein
MQEMLFTDFQIAYLHAWYRVSIWYVHGIYTVCIGYVHGMSLKRWRQIVSIVPKWFKCSKWFQLSLMAPKATGDLEIACKGNLI